MSTGEFRRIRSLRELPQQAMPARDLWPGIAAELTPRRRSWTVPASLAATLVLVAVGLVVGIQVRSGANSSPEIQNTGAFVQASLMDPAYQRQRETLLRELPAKLQSLPPESQQRVRDSLQIIQNAMQDIEAELGRDSGNVLLQELFISTSQEEMRVLTTVGYFDGFNQEI